VPKTSRPFVRFLWPTTRLGWWSVGLLGAFVAGFALLQLLVASGQRGGKTFLDNLWLSGTGFAAGASAIAAAVVGIIATARKHERSVPVMLAVLIGTWVFLFVAGELLVGHG